jgi:hypothetical protein
MSLGELASMASIVSAATFIVSVIYVSVQIRHNTRAVRASAFQQVIESFAGISLDIAKDKSLVELNVRASQDFAALSEVERAQYSLMLLSFLRRAENVFFQTEIQLLHTDHWSGIRDSIKAVVTPPGALDCWSTIKSRMNPEFRAFIDTLIGEQSPVPGPVGPP